MKQKIPVAVLGATGTVGQKFLLLLENHPWFEINELLASPQSAGKPYAEASVWKQDRPLPEKWAHKIVKKAGEPVTSRLLFSGMDASVAGPLEAQYAHAGHFVISNAKNHRMEKYVPLVIPEINPHHFEMIKEQPYSGAIITNPNCVVMPMAMILAPLHAAFGIEWVQISTMQAISGAGYPGLSSFDILGNVIPFIKGEESKIESEVQKILGNFEGKSLQEANFTVSAQCNRVAVLDGHTENLSIRFKKEVHPQEAKELLRTWRGMPQEKKLPTAPQSPILVFEENDRPQPRRDVGKEKGMAACVGRIRKCSIGHLKMVVMGHNTIRGAAGAAVLNAEACLALGYLD